MLAGVFVGGAGRRMGGAAKGLLIAPGGDPIVVRTCGLLMQSGVPCVLVGEHAAYREVGAQLGVATLADQPAGIGPLGGLIALLRAARGDSVLAIGGDMPYLTRELVAELCDAPAASAVAPRMDGRWQPLFARFDATTALPVAVRRAALGQFALHGLLDELGTVELLMTEDSRAGLRDWDLPGDVEEQ